METRKRVVTGDERTLILFQALLNQGMSLDDIFVFLSLDDKDDFLKRNDLTDKLWCRDLLAVQISEQIKKLAEINRKK